MSAFKEHMALLGFKVRDLVTGFEGVAESISLDLYGCVQAVVRPPMTDKGEMQDGRWFDVKRLKPISDEPVMKVPAFETVQPKRILGGSEKPAFSSRPMK